MKKELTPIGAAYTLSDLKVWVEECSPDVILIPKAHLLTHIREFNHEYKDRWNTFNGVPILYVE